MSYYVPPPKKRTLGQTMLISAVLRIGIVCLGMWFLLEMYL